MKNIVLAYRFLYAVVMLVFLANIVKAIHFDMIPSKVEAPLLILSAVANFGLLLFVIVFPKRRTTTPFLACFLWLGCFTWFAWWSSVSPFRMHEFHSFDPRQDMLEAHQHVLISATIFALLCIWFISVIFVSKDRLRGLPESNMGNRKVSV